MKFGKVVSDVVHTPPPKTQRPAHSFVPVALFASTRFVVGQAQPVGGQAAWVGDAGASAQDDHKTAVYEMDQETYQMRKDT